MIDHKEIQVRKLDLACVKLRGFIIAQILLQIAKVEKANLSFETRDSHTPYS